MGFEIEYGTCGTGEKVTIKKTPIGETPAQPIYPDLVNIYVPTPDIEDLPFENDDEEDLKNEEEGKSFSFTFEELVQKGVDIAKLIFTIDDYKKRENVLDAREYKFDRKLATTGKPINNNDPYPYDEKIEELEQHIPFAKIHEVSWCDPHPHIIELTKIVMELSDKVEKRMVQLENIMSTVVRHQGRLASRMFINCVYYGGQDENRKYQAIRCLHDDRIADGQTMTLDQCLNCTRYEPIIGKVYEIEDETGRSLENILDDNQMAYKSMDDEIKATRTEEAAEKEKTVHFELDKLTERNENEKDFKDMWDEGFKMDWNLVPVEKQSPHVKYEDGSTSKMLPSNYRNLTGYGNFSGGGGGGATHNLVGQEAVIESMKRGKEILDNVTDPELRQHIDKARNYANNNTDVALKRMAEAGYEDILVQVADKEGVDPLLILALIVVESTGRVDPKEDRNDSYWGLMQVYKGNLPSNYFSLPDIEKAKINIEKGTQMFKQKLKACWNTTNEMLGIVAFNAGEGMILGVSSSGVKPVYDPGLNKDDHNNWSFVDIAPNLKRNVQTYYKSYPQKVAEVMQYYPKVNAVYHILLERKGDLVKQGLGGLTFPFGEKTLKKGVYYTSGFGMRVNPISGKVEGHAGIDLAGGGGNEILAAGDGVVDYIGFQEYMEDGKKLGAGQYIKINHGNNLYTLYMHLVKGSQKVAVGDQVKAGQPIGIEGNTGGSTGPHLHFEVRRGGTNRGDAVNPEEYFPFLKGKIGQRINP